MIFHITDYRMKSVLSLTLALVLLFSLTVPALGAVGGSCGSGLTWTLDGAALTVSGQGAMADFSDAEMPPWYPYADSITSVTVEEGVTALGSLAFYGCTALTDVSLPDSLTVIGDRAFKDCASLTYVSVPRGVAALGRAAFEGCTALAAADLPEGLVSIGDMAFYRCAALRSVTVPASVQQMGMVVFGHCASLLRARILCPVSRLPDMTFFGCTSLVEVSLPEEMSQVGSQAFQDCDSLSAVYYSGGETEAVSDAVEADTHLSARGGAVVSDAMTADMTLVTDSGDQVQYTVQDNTAALITVERSLVNDSPAAIGNISVVLKTADGWSEVASMISSMILERTRRGESGVIHVDVQAGDFPLDGSVMTSFTGESVQLNITAAGGARWSIDMSALRRGEMASQWYHLSAALTRLQEKPDGMACAILYRMSTVPDVDFPATLGLPLGEGTARRLASLVSDRDKRRTVQSSVVVDGDGMAWIPVYGDWDSAEWYLAIDAEGVWMENAIVPATMQEEYGASEGMLTDAAGNRYEITGRTSRWGITGGRFALYVGAVMLGVVLVVTVIMVSRNQIIKGREAGRAAAERAVMARAARKRKEEETPSQSTEN